MRDKDLKVFQGSRVHIPVQNKGQPSSWARNYFWRWSPPSVIALPYSRSKWSSRCTLAWKIMRGHLDLSFGSREFFILSLIFSRSSLPSSVRSIPWRASSLAVIRMVLVELTIPSWAMVYNTIANPSSQVFTKCKRFSEDLTGDWRMISINSSPWNLWLHHTHSVLIDQVRQWERNQCLVSEEKLKVFCPLKVQEIEIVT